MTEPTSREDRYELGRTVLDAIDGTAGANVVDSLNDIAPELGTPSRRLGVRRNLLPSRTRSARPATRDPRDADRTRRLRAAARRPHQRVPERRTDPRTDHRSVPALGGLLRIPPSPECDVHSQEGIRRAWTVAARLTAVVVARTLPAGSRRFMKSAPRGAGPPVRWSPRAPHPSRSSKADAARRATGLTTSTAANDQPADGDDRNEGDRPVEVVPCP